MLKKIIPLSLMGLVLALPLHTSAMLEKEDMKIGGITFVNTESDLLASYGSPLSVNTHELLENLTPHRTWYYGKTLQITFSGTTGKVITVAAPYHMGVETPRGVRVGMEKEEVIKRYGLPDEVLGENYFYAGEEGILRFKFHDEKVSGLYLVYGTEWLTNNEEKEQKTPLKSEENSLNTETSTKKTEAKILPHLHMALGHITIGNLENHIIASYGKPNDLVQGMHDEYTYVYGQGKDFMVTFDKNHMVKKVTTTANNGIATPAGLIVGLDEKTLRKVYGTPQVDGDILTYLGEHHTKLEFTILDGYITTITLLKSE